MPVISALIGWGNVIAIRMLFWPRKPVPIPPLKEMRRVWRISSALVLEKMERFVPALLSSFRSFLDNVLKERVAREIEDLFSRLGHDLAAELQESRLLGNLVAEKIRSYDITGLESLILQVAHTELRYIELAGAVLGGLIGILQSLIVSVL